LFGFEHFLIGDVEASRDIALCFGLKYYGFLRQSFFSDPRLSGALLDLALVLSTS
jgi:hypothetical protein